MDLLRGIVPAYICNRFKFTGDFRHRGSHNRQVLQRVFILKDFIITLD